VDTNRFRTHSLQDERVLRILSAALAAVEPGQIVRDYLTEARLPAHRRVFLLGIGKAAEPMTLAAADALSRFTAGLIITKHASDRAAERVAVIESGHPIPDGRSLAAGLAALDFVSRLHEDDLLVCLISGGGSSLVSVPAEGVTLEDIQSRTASLLAGGATIQEINNYRRQVDRIKGGGLARATRARIVSLILSDVIGNSLETIASGLTVDPRLGKQVQNIILGDLRRAAEAALRQAKQEGLTAEILDLQVEGEAGAIGSQLARKLREERSKRAGPFCLIAGGETTVTLRGGGKGGRNQELALAAVNELAGLQNVLFVSLATDGDDGPTDAAGAVVNGGTRRRAAELGMSVAEYFSRNDAYSFFDPLDDLLKPGYTGTNVNDLILLCGF
jgi:glycerate 2-kinase